MLFALILAACTASAPEVKDSEPDTDGGRAAAAVAVEAKAASRTVNGLVEQVDAATSVEPIVQPVPAPEIK